MAESHAKSAPVAVSRAAAGDESDRQISFNILPTVVARCEGTASLIYAKEDGWAVDAVPEPS